MRRMIWLAFALGTALVVAGCETTATKKAAGEVPVVERGGPTAPEEAAEAARVHGLAGTPGFKGHPLDNPASPLSKRVIYFDYDSSDILDKYRGIIEAHAAYLASQPGASVDLEGHTDERGSREYNLALGERRALAVDRMMVLLGASDSQIRTVSYGEERPAAEGDDESAWRLNRRVEIIYRVR